jgi:hypothetical protein
VPVLELLKVLHGVAIALYDLEDPLGENVRAARLVVCNGGVRNADLATWYSDRNLPRHSHLTEDLRSGVDDSYVTAFGFWHAFAPWCLGLRAICECHIEKPWSYERRSYVDNWVRWTQARLHRFSIRSNLAVPLN